MRRDRAGQHVAGLALVAGLLAVFVLPCRADIYRYVDANGVVHFTNTPTRAGYTFYMKERPRGPRKLQEVIRHYADQYRLEEALIQAVIKVESDFNPRSVSHKGAVGMMQLMPQTARDMDVADPMNPSENIRGGSRYLRLMLDRFGDDLDLALAAYNAGPENVRRYEGIPPFAETRNYVKKVKKYLRVFRREGSNI